MQLASEIRAQETVDMVKSQVKCSEKKLPAGYSIAQSKSGP